MLGSRTCESGGRHRVHSILILLMAALASASMWFYVVQILVPYQRVDAANHERPRGNLSDLYPRWLGARELLLHHRNPYGDDVTVEIQKGYYGRALDANRPDDPKDRQGFAYPVYVVFLLAPLIGLPFHTAQIFFHWMLIFLTAASVWLWLRALRWRVAPLAVCTGVVLTLGSVPVVQGIKLQQLSLLAAALMAGAAACVAGGFLLCGGILLALATFKPQLAWPLVAWLLLWTASDWRKRWKLALGFALVMVLLLAGAEFVLPGWWRQFADAIAQYHSYTQNQSVLDQLIPWYAGKIVAAIAVLACGYSVWTLRTAAGDKAEFGCATALVMALTVLVVPMYAPYNQILLLPAVLVFLRDRAFFSARSRAVRFIYFAGVIFLLWPWIASLGLSGTHWLLSPARAMQWWVLPFLPTFMIPVLIFGLALLKVRNISRPARTMTGGLSEAH